MFKSAEDYREFDLNFSEKSIVYNKIDLGYLFRNQLVAKIRAKNNIGNNPVRLTLRVYLRLLLSALKTFPNIFRKKDVWVFSNAERRKKYNDHYVDRVASIVSEANESVLYIENPVLSSHKYPTKDIILSDAFFFLISYVVGFFCYSKKKMIVPKEFYSLGEQYGVGIDVKQVMRRFLGQYKVMTWFLKYVHKPKRVYLVYPNGYNGYIKAFKDVNIPVVELQHGVIYPTHPSYNFPYCSIAKEFYPDYVFVYGHKDKECLEKLDYVEKDNIFVVGSYGLWYCKFKLQVRNQYLERILQLGYKKLVLVTATNDDLDVLYRFGELLSVAKDDWGILLLPRTSRNNLQSVNNLIVLDTRKVNVFELYKTVDFHLTQNSSCALEALYMAVPSFILELNRPSIFSRNYRYIKSLNYVKNHVELLSMIENGHFLFPDESDVSQVFENEVLDSFRKSQSKLKRR
jgi:hypothetical protein